MKTDNKPKTLELECEIEFSLSAANLQTARCFLNKVHTGSETVPLDAAVSKDLKEAHYSLNRVRLVIVKAIISEDGNIRLKKD